jgi:hypothetical protein
MTPTRQEILDELAKMSERYPNWRFGQMVANVSFWAAGPKIESIWDVEDDEFLKALQNHLRTKQIE